MTYWPWKNECGRQYQHRIKKQNHAKPLETKTADGLGAKRPAKQHCLGKIEGGREAFWVSASWEETCSQIRLHLYFPEGSWDWFSPCAPAVPRWGSWSCIPCLQSCSGVGTWCRSVGNTQHVGARLGNAMDTGFQDVCVCEQVGRQKRKSQWPSWRIISGSFSQRDSFSPPKPTYFYFSSLHIFHIVPSKPLIGAMAYMLWALLYKTW